MNGMSWSWTIAPRTGRGSSPMRSPPGTVRRGCFARLTGAPLPEGWVGKVWALEQGVQALTAHNPVYLLLSDADIRHEPGSLRRLVAESEHRRLSLNSRLARLWCEAPAERLLIPAFVYFFNLLYPMLRVNDPASRVAAAAGGCILVRADALTEIGGVRGDPREDHR